MSSQITRFEVQTKDERGVWASIANRYNLKDAIAIAETEKATNKHALGVRVERITVASKFIWKSWTTAR